MKELTRLEQQILFDSLKKAATFLDVVQLQSPSAGTSMSRMAHVDSIRDTIELISKPLQLTYNVKVQREDK